ncbi:MAG: hypothetical protein GF416_08275 [Candidatus Altiarchaeales archaeon]|nr:hypothetical protein [Candidatus Altiarchaeales archaeon]MBD3417111.1 hypothetical protein [Candidatus Altiarchaeales archaeon]
MRWLVLMVLVSGCLCQGPQSIDKEPSDTEDASLTFPDARLDIPAGAMPDGMGSNGLSVELVESGSRRVYRLQPDGLKFEKPVNLTVDLGAYTGRLPVFYTISEDNVEAVEDAYITIDDDRLKATLTLGHFSDLIVEGLGNFSDGFFNLDLDAGDTLEGETVDAKLKVTVDREEIMKKSDRMYIPDMLYQLVAPSIQVWGIFKGQGSPLKNLGWEKEPYTSIDGSYVLDINHMRCESPGDAKIEVHFRLGYGYIVINWDNKETINTYTNRHYVKMVRHFKCLPKPLIEPETPLLQVAERECMWHRDSRYNAKLHYICRWYFKSLDNRSLACMERPRSAYDKTMLFNKSDGESSRGHFEVIEDKYGRTRNIGSSLAYRCPEPGECDCGEKLAYITFNNVEPLEKPGDTVTIRLGQSNNNIVRYEGDGDSITLTHPGIEQAEGGWHSV